MDTQPPTESEIQPKPRSRPAKKAEKKALNLNLPEKLFILSIDDDQGAIAASIKATLRYGLAGALLAELALDNKIILEDGRLALVASVPYREAFYDKILELIAAEEKPRKLSYWVETIGSKQIVKQVAERLAERNVITIKKQRYGWISPYEVYPQVDASAKYWVKQRLREIVLLNEVVAPSEIILFSLLRACQFLKFVFTSDEHKSASKKVEAMAKGEVFGKSVAKILEKR